MEQSQQVEKIEHAVRRQDVLSFHTYFACTMYLMKVVTEYTNYNELEN